MTSKITWFKDEQGIDRVKVQDKKYSDLNQTPETLDRIFQEFIDEADTK